MSKEIRNWRYPIPQNIKTFLKNNTDNTDLEDFHELDPESYKIWKILSDGVSEDNYENFFHYMLWFEESRETLDLRLFKIRIYEDDKEYMLVIPKGKQESLKLRRGSTIRLRKHKTKDVYLNVRITEVKNDIVYVKKSKRSINYELGNAVYVDVLLLPFNYVMLHKSVENVYTSKKNYIFPSESQIFEKTSITRYFNANIKKNAEQRTAVECIVSGTSGNAPFLLLGPPGTGKTATIVEAILQLVAADDRNRILVSAHSNKAVDNVACVLQEYKEHFKETKNLLLRINSKGRESPVPECLKDDSVYGTTDYAISRYRIILCTLCCLSNYCLNSISHVVIDEAAQANEPSCLIPVSRINGVRPLILAGDHQQLGPVVVSNVSKKYGLGLSLMERLKNNYCMYEESNSKSKHIVMLKNNYRSDPNIIYVPNRLFYGGHLRALAAIDPLSNKNILNRRMKCRSVVFHQVFSKETKVGTSYCNYDELDIIGLYVLKLITNLGVKQKDIGIIATYASQVDIIKEWIDKKGLLKIAVDTVDAFQGQEKRVIIISTVRGRNEQKNAPLGFVQDVKRFNVAVTRAKAKVIVIGNPLSLMTSSVWSSYITYCTKLGTRYHLTKKMNAVESSNLRPQPNEENFDTLLNKFQHMSFSK